MGKGEGSVGAFHNKRLGGFPAELGLIEPQRADIVHRLSQGIEADRAKSTLRVSFGFESKKEDIDALAQGLSSAVEEINRGVRK